MERESFEDKLKASFEKAEISPSEKVWMNLELELAKADSHAMKRRVAYFKLLAAASVVFALSIAGASVYFLNSAANERALSLKADSSIPSDPSEKGSLKTDDNDVADNGTINGNREEGPSRKMNEDPGRQDNQATLAFDVHNSSTRGASEFAILSAETGYADGLSLRELDRDRLSGLLSDKTIVIDLFANQHEEDPVQAMMARLAIREQQIQNQSKENKKKGKDQNEKLWTSLGFAAGTFNSVGAGLSQPVASATTYSSTAPAARNEAKASGQSYTVGLNVGTKISERWVVQGGLNYLTQLSDYTAQAVVGTSDFQSFRPVSTNELEKMNDATSRANSRVVTTAPYNVNNNVKYLSIPLQAGYMLVNKKFGVQLNAGVSTDLFLQNTKTAEGDNIDSIDQGLGDDSPYRPMNFSGIMGTELSYRFGDHYRIAFNPGVRYPFSSIYKSDLGVQSTPLTFDVGLRFRYIFH